MSLLFNGTTDPFVFSIDRQTSVDIIPATGGQYYWDLAVDGDYLYAASGSEGVVIFDITDAAAPVYETTVFSKNPAGANVFQACTDAIIVGTVLIMCARNISATPSYITLYDITDPTAPVWTGSYESASGDWYQGLDTDGTYVYVAGQLAGLIVFDISGAAPTVHGSLTTGNWETSRLAVHGGYVYCANHGYGVRIVDIATPASPGAVTDREIATPVYNSVQLRARNVVADGNYLYMSPNTSTTTSHPERGLCVLDITDPTTVPANGSTWIVTPIDAADVDTWNEWGDKPILGLMKLDNYVYLANGQRGTALYYVADPTTPIYKGLYGTDTPAETNLYKVEAFKKDNYTYMYYGDGAENDQKHTLFVDLIKNIPY